MDNNNMINVAEGKTQQRKNGWESISEQLESFKKSKLHEINLSVILQPTIISFAALIISFFLDLAVVPFLGNVSINIAHIIFPDWVPNMHGMEPLSFWWLTPFAFLFFLLMGVKAFRELKIEAAKSDSKENLDKIISASLSVIDAISTALPLIGAAILLISIKLGPEIFLGFSVPFEIKALIVLAIGKLFEPVLDVLNIKFNDVISSTNQLKEKLEKQKEAENWHKLTSLLEQNMQGNTAVGNIPVDYQKNLEVLREMNELSKQTYKNFGATYQILDKMNNLLNDKEQIVKEMTNLSGAISQMAANMNNDAVGKSLQSLESILNKR